MTPADKKVVSTIGHVVRRKSGMEVRCAKCGQGISSNVPMSMEDARADLLMLDWREGRDKLWRHKKCPPPPKPSNRPLSPIEMAIDKACAKGTP